MDVDIPVQGADGSWSLFSNRWQEGYHSSVGAFTETHMVYGQTFDRWQSYHRTPEHAHIWELGFGLGYGFCLALEKLLALPGNIPKSYTAFERCPLSSALLPPLPTGWEKYADLRKTMLCKHVVELEGICCCLVVGDVRQTLGNGLTDVVFWDAFSPKRCPECWEEMLLRRVYERVHDGGCFGTYSSAHRVKERLTRVGFSVETLPLSGPKREGTLGWKWDTFLIQN